LVDFCRVFLTISVDQVDFMGARRATAAHGNLDRRRNARKTRFERFLAVVARGSDCR
jgi:hypothetical protein